ncbi:hypothetical protein GCM10025864_42940 [Luteimicrobium album]|uniref:Uncharacterized protein n=1 Tax=Luteimicrobium album TaxID=1054550 RepID=A0ABQ6IA06_9MICO|nr:hypothetical protein GCM10025864_42940 [Luteimicrobium album]
MLDPTALAHAGSVRFRFPSRSSWNQDVEVFLTGATDDVLVPSDEITPAWYPVDYLPLASMWDDARYWLPTVLGGGRVDATITFAADARTVEATDPVLTPVPLARH